MINEDGIFRKAREIILNKTDLKEEMVTLKSHFRDDLNLSSIVIVSIVLAVETEFDIEVSDEEIVNLATLGDAVRAISDKLQAKQSAIA